MNYLYHGFLHENKLNLQDYKQMACFHVNSVKFGVYTGNQEPHFWAQSWYKLMYYLLFEKPENLCTF